jgi:hypothetical protein
MKGVDPAEHEVVGELERIKKYYAKIRAVEEPETSTFDPRLHSVWGDH